MIRNILLSIIFVFALNIHNAHSTGRDHIEDCKKALTINEDSHTMYSQGYCVGFVSGVYRKWRKEQPKDCNTPQTSIFPIVSFIVMHIEDKPYRIDDPFDVLIERALNEGWPCNR